VTVVTITLPVAHGTNIIILVGCLAMIGRKKAGVIEFAVGKIFFGRIMAIDAEAEILPFLIRMPEGRDVAAAHGCTGKHKTDDQKNSDYHQNPFVLHRFPLSKLPNVTYRDFLISVLTFQHDRLLQPLC
jgi:hypothetical protein